MNEAARSFKGSDSTVHGFDHRSSCLLSDQVLHRACLRHQPIDVVDRLLMSIADINARSWDGQTALIVCCDIGRDDIVRSLLRHGADLHIQTPSGLDALYLACVHGYVSIVARLMKHGADAITRRPHGLSPLEAAAKRGHLDVLRTLGCFGVNLGQYIPMACKRIRGWLCHVRQYNWCPFDYALDLRDVNSIHWLLRNTLAWIRPSHVLTLQTVPCAKTIDRHFHAMISNISKPWTRATHALFVSLYGEFVMTKLVPLIAVLNKLIDSSCVCLHLMEYVHPFHIKSSRK